MVVAPRKVATLCLLVFLAGREQQALEAFVCPSTSFFAATNKRFSVILRSASTSSVETDVKTEDLSIPYDAAARLAFEEWKEKFGKQDDNFSAERFQIFKANYEAVTVANVIAAREARELSIANGDGAAVISSSRMELNEFADLTNEEFEALQNKTPVIEGDVEVAGVSELVSSTPAAPDDKVRSAYEEWLKAYNKTPDEARYPVFEQNFLLMEKLCSENGTPMKLNEFADCTEEEYRVLTSATAETVQQAEATAEPEIIELKKEQPKVEVAQVKEAVEATKKILEGFKFPEINVEIPSLLNAEAMAEEEKRIEALMKEKEEQKIKREKEMAEAFAASEKERVARQEAQRKEAERQKEETEKAAIAAAKIEAEKEAKQIAKRRAFQEEANKIIREQALAEAEKLQRVLEGRKREVQKELKQEQVAPSIKEFQVEPKSAVVEPITKVKEQPLTAAKKEAKVEFPNILSIFSAPPEQKKPPKKSDDIISQPVIKSSVSTSEVKSAPVEKKETKSELPNLMSILSAPFEQQKPPTKSQDKVPLPKKTEEEKDKKSEVSNLMSIFSTPPAQKSSSLPKSVPSVKVEAAKKERPTLSLADFFPPTKEPVKEDIQIPVKKTPESSQIDRVSIDDPVSDALKSLFGGKVKKEKEPEPQPVSVEPPKVVEKKASFQFFGQTAKTPVASKIKPTPEPSTKTTEKSSPFFFGKPAAPKVKPAPAEPIVAIKKEPFSFFGASKAAPKSEEVSPSSAAKKSTAAKKSEAIIPKAKKIEVVSSGTKKLTAAKKVEVATSPKQKQEPFSFFGKSGSEQASSSAEKKPSVGLSFGTIRILSSQNKSTDGASKDSIPTISNFVQNADGTVTGKVSGSSKFRNGETITTSPVKRGAKSGEIITTASGSKYRLK